MTIFDTNSCSTYDYTEDQDLDFDFDELCLIAPEELAQEGRDSDARRQGSDGPEKKDGTLEGWEEPCGNKKQHRVFKVLNPREYSDVCKALF